MPAAPPISVQGVPDELAELVMSIYAHAAGVGGSEVEPRFLPVAGIAEGMAGRTAIGGTAVIDRTGIGLVRAGDDLIAAVDDGSGWRIVAVDLPTLDHRNLGYTSAVIVAVGSDARPGQDPLRSRADSLHLIGFDGVDGTFDIVGIPRDSWVTIPGHSTGKVTESLARGGPDTLIATLETLAGYSLDGTLITGFEGFQEALGNVLGGIQITLDAPMSDSAAGADFPPGEQYMNGPQALAFARARKSLAKGDVDRQRNGGLVILAAATTARFRPMEDVPSMLADAASWAWTDLSAAQILQLAVTSMVSPILEVRNEVLPGVPGNRSGASTIELAPGAALLLNDLADGSLGG
jgi:LCP family protein required for cell wall assembly